jgi:branched-chain amino acid transport system permease protein
MIKAEKESIISRLTNADALFRQEKAIIKSKASAIILVAGFFVLLLLPPMTSRYIIYIVTLIIINVISAQGLNLLTGYAGQVSLGHGAFMAIGAYLTAIMFNDYHLPFWIVFILAPFISGIVGLLVGLPALRLRGLYLAMVTIAFHMVVSLGLMSLEITGGYQGLDVPKPRIGFIILDSEWKLYYLTLLVGLLFLFFSINLSRTKICRAFIAIREKEISAQAMGISLWSYKTLAFFLASVYAGVAGSLFAVVMGHITPNHFPLMLSIEYIMMVIVGGPGSIMGIIFGSVLITILPYILLSLVQTIGAFSPMVIVHFADIKIIIYGAIIIIFLMYIPGGFQGVIIKFSAYFQRMRVSRS